jgi:hypothetical protein
MNSDNKSKVDETYDYGDGCFVDRILTGETRRRQTREDLPAVPGR